MKLNVVKSAEVITIGEPMAVYISEYPGQLKDVNKYYRGIAGAELNVAVGLSRLNHSVRYLTKLGKDPYGEMIFDFLQKEGNLPFFIPLLPCILCQNVTLRICPDHR